jgi:hypothetical protein
VMFWLMIFCWTRAEGFGRGELGTIAPQDVE